MKKKMRILLLLLLVVGVALLWYLDAFSIITVDNIQQLSEFIRQFGLLAPFVFVLLYVLATVLFLPGFPLTLFAGILFGPIYGILWVSIASTLGASLAFLIGRYMGRDFVEKKLAGSQMLMKLDEGIKSEGWKMVAITRLVPLFPFNVQNYAYGLTGVSFKVYVLVSWVCMLPATIAYLFLAGAIVGGDGDGVKTITYIGVGIATLIALSLVSKRIGKEKSK